MINSIVSRLLIAEKLKYSHISFIKKQNCCEQNGGHRNLRVTSVLFRSGKSKGFPLFSCPDKNKVNFIPRGSAFCPVKLLCSSLFSPISPSFHTNSGLTTQVTPTQPAALAATFLSSADLRGGGGLSAESGDGSAHVVLTSWSSGIHDQTTYK